MAGNRQQFTLQFNADTAQAKRAIQDLNNSLKKVSEASINDFGISRELEEASNAAKELRTHIAAATNASTGKLNLNEFNSSLKMAESNLSSLLSKLANGGQMGQAAFLSFANAIAQSEAPLKRVNSTLQSVAQTLKNTIKWELSSNIVHGLESALSGAVSYAKNLNTSLTNIRIVTGQSAEDMAKFATAANKAAKELSTTTKAYADASLIYYQQGDNAEQAAKKAAITIKAANSSFNTSAAEMSEYLTSVWNSYKVGANELERYVDIMAALGAKTATSLEEIATSMQKVAATANTVGVSMEQVSSIIATVSSVTRESAESIGTSYKTIFARMGDLKLGETLEDGVGLGQVSKQLSSIGVQILDTSGNLRDMGDIITDLGTKWQTMTAAQKTATAQVVAGKRQYTQLMALFENWDMYQQNMNIASSAEGSLQDMADIYAESWEAASARVKASMETIFSSLINDQAIIKLTNVVASVVNGISGFIDTLGGAGGALKLLGSIGLIVFQKQISNGITMAIGKMQQFFASKNQVSEYVTNLERVGAALKQMQFTSDKSGDSVQIENSIKLIELKTILASKEANLNETQQAAAQAMISSMSEEINMVNQLGQAYDQVDTNIQELISDITAVNLRDMGGINAGQTLQQADTQGFMDLLSTYYQHASTEEAGAQMYAYMQKLGVSSISQAESKYAKAVEDTSALDAAIARIQSLKQSGDDAETSARELGLAFDFIGQYAQKAGPTAQSLFTELKTNISTLPIDEAKVKFQQLKEAIIMNEYGVQSYAELRQKLADLGIIVPSNASKFDLLEQAAKKAGLSFFTLDTNAKRLQGGLGNLKSKLEGMGTSFNNILNKVQSVASGLMSLSSSLTTAQNLAKNWDDNGLAEKIGGIASALSSVASTAVAGFQVGGVWGAVIGAVLGIGASIIGAVQGYQEELEEQRVERLTKSAERSTESVNQLKQEQDEIESLLTSYGVLMTEYNTTGTMTDGLIEATLALADAYNITDGTIIKTTEDLKNLQNQITLSTIAANKQRAEELKTTINSAWYGVNDGEDLIARNTNLSLNAGTLVYDQAQMQAAYDQGLLTEDQRIFFEQYGQSGASSSGQGIFSQNVIDDNGRLLEDYVYQTWTTVQEPLSNWTKATVDQAIEILTNQEMMPDMEEMAQEYGMSIQELLSLGQLYIDEYGQLVMKSYNTGSFQYFDPYNAYVENDRLVMHGDASKVYATQYTMHDAYYGSWQAVSNPSANNANLNVSHDDYDRGAGVETYNLMDQFVGLYDYFGGKDNEWTRGNVSSVLHTMFTDSDWTSYFEAYVNQQGPEYKAKYEEFIQKLAENGFETIDEIWAALTELGFDNTFRTDHTFDNSKANVISKLAKERYTTAQTQNQDALQTAIFGEDFHMSDLLAHDGEMLFDFNGELIWNDVEKGTPLIEQYQAIQAASKNLQEKRAKILNYIAENNITEDSPEYAILQGYIAEMDEIDAIYQKIIGDDTLATQTLTPIITAQTELNQLGVIDTLLNNTQSGKNSYDTITELINTIDNAENPALLGITAEKGTDEYFAQRNALITSLIQVYANDLDGMTQLYLNLENSLRSIGQENLLSSYMPQLIAAGIDTTQELTNDIIRAIMMAALQGVTDLSTFDLFTSATKTNNGMTEIDQLTAEQKAFQAATSKRTTDASAAADLYKYLFDVDGNANAFLTTLGLDKVYTYEEFKGLDKTAQDEYLALIDQRYSDYISGRWEAAIAATPDGEDGKTFKDLYDRWSLDAQKAGQYTLEQIDGEGSPLHVKGYNEAISGGYSTAGGQLYKNGVLVTSMTDPEKGYLSTLMMEEQYQSDVANYENAVAGARAYALMTPKAQQTSDELTAAEKQIMQMERAKNQVDSLVNAISEFQSNGKLSKSTKNALEMLGINADDIDTMDELIDQIENLQEVTDITNWDDVATASGLTTDQLTGENGIFRADGTVKGFDELGEGSTITQEQYNSAVQAYEMKLAILGIDTQELELQYQQAEATKAVNEAIELQKQTVEKLTEKAAKMTAAYDALSNSIGESALNFETITKATQAGLDVSNWSSDVSTQLDIISEAAYKAYEAEVKVLEAQKLNVEGVKNLTRNRTDYAKLINDMLSKDTFDSGELDKFINDYFGQFDGATQEAVRSYISSLEAAGQSFTWEGLIEHLTAENLMTQNEIDLLRANLKDGLTGMLDEAIAEHQAAAQEVADAWVTAFDAIMKAKEGLADGKSIAESLMGDTESQAALLSQYFQNNPNATNEEATAWLRNRNLSQNAPEFTPDSWSLSNWSQSRGIFSVANRNKSQEGTSNEFASSASQWEMWVNDRFRDTWDQMDATARKEAGVETYDAYVEKAWADFLNGRSKEEAYWDERAAMVVAEADANQQWMNSQVQTAQTTYQNTVESAQNQQSAWQQIYDAQQQVLADETGELTLEDALGDNLYSLLNTINEGREGEDRYTLDDLTSMTLSDIATQVNAQTAVISAAEVQLGKDLAAGTDLDGNTVDLSGTAAGEEALEEAHATSATAQDNQIGTEELDADVLESYGNATGMTPNEFQAYAEHLNSMIDAQHRFDTATKEGKEALYNYAKAVAKAADGFEDLQSITEDTWKTLKDGSKKGSKEWIKGIESLRKTTSKVFGTDMKYITGEFVENHLDELEKMANGTEEEALRAQDAIQDDLVAEILKMEGIEATATVNIDGEQQVINILDTLQTQFDEWDGKDIGFTITPDIEPALASMGQLLASGTMTAEQITAALNSIGWQPNIQYMEHEVTEQDKSQGYASTTILGKTYTTTISEDVEVGSIVKIPYIASASKMTPPGGGARPSGGGGGGGGGGKPKKIDKKDSEDHKERYHPVEQQLERVSDALEKVDKMKRRAFGESHIKAMESEIGLLKDEIKLQEEYLRQAKEYLALDAQRVASLGGVFDSQGNIANYDELIDSIVAKYNAFVDKYNAASASEQENMEEEKEKMDEWFEDAMEWISQYEETLNLIGDKQNEILELQNQISEKTLEKIQYKVEYKVEINEAEKNYLDYINDKYDEVLEKQDLLMDNYIRQGQIAEQNLSYLATARQELEAAFAAGELNQADYVTGLQEIQSQILDNLEAIQEVKEAIEELYGKTLDLASEELDKHTSKIDAASEAMGSYMSILQLMGKGQTFEDLLFFYEKQYDYNMASLESQMSYLNVLKEEEQYYLARMNSAEGLTETERIQYEALQETMNEVQANILSKTEETLQALKDMYDTTIEDIMKDLEESMVGVGNDLAWLTEEYGFYMEEMEQYVSSQRELYEISKLNRNIQQSINDTTSSVHKKQLKALQDEINAQSELKELSEYEIEMMNLKYELLLKQIALEEAQNAKSTVRLTRDSEGNMVYQYTADQDAINQAQQEYEDVLQQMADTNWEYEQDIYNQTLQLRQDTLEAIKEIAMDETLTEEQKQQRINEILDHYYERSRYLQEQYNIVSENTMATNELIADHYGIAVEEITDRTKGTVAEIIGEMINDTDNYRTEMEDAYERIRDAMEEYAQKIAEVTELTNTNYGSMIDSVENYDKVTEDAKNETIKMTDSLRQEVSQIHTTTTAWDNYISKLNSVIGTYESMYLEIQKVIQAQAKLAGASVGGTTTTTTKTTTTTTKKDTTTKNNDKTGGTGDKTGGTGGTGTQDKSSGLNIGAVLGAVVGGVVGGGVGSKVGGTVGAIIGSGVTSVAGAIVGNKLGDLIKDKTGKKYATGGLADYTGPAWVDGTKSRPELVLNQDDTQKLLDTVKVVNKLDQATLTMMDEYINLATAASRANMYNLHAGTTQTTKETELQQQVHITAEFPNVQDSNEIQDAFDNLINRAAQYIGSKR